MIQILANLTSYLLLAIYCHEEYQEKIPIKKIRQLRVQTQNEQRNLASSTNFNAESLQNIKEQNDSRLYAKNLTGNY